MRYILLILAFGVLYAEDMLSGPPVLGSKDAIAACDNATIGIASGSAAESLTALIMEHWYRESAKGEDSQKITSPFGVGGLVKDHYGNSIGGKNWEYIGSDAIANTSYRFIYVVRMETGYLPIVYTWYNRGDRWFLFGVHWGNMAEAALDKYRVVQK